MELPYVEFDYLATIGGTDQITLRQARGKVGHCPSHGSPHQPPNGKSSATTITNTEHLLVPLMYG